MPSADRVKISTGIADLDNLLAGLRQGDNVVWRVDSIDDYRFYVDRFCRFVRKSGLEIVYFRFADHPPLLMPAPGITIINLDPREGFEQFAVEVFRLISRGVEGNYIFDSMSLMPQNCYSDRMIGNFFKLICPKLHRQDSLAYFSFMRHKHSFHAEQFISDTTQILIDVYNHDDVRYIKPFNISDRYSSCMYRLHRQLEDSLTMIGESLNITEILFASPWPGLRSASYRMIGLWDRMFLSAEEILEETKKNGIISTKAQELTARLQKYILSRDEKLLSIAAKYLTLNDIISLWKRMIGTGFVGGKSVGVILAHAVLRAENPALYNKLEKHDSFYIGSDVFYTFLIDNGLWWTKQEQKDPSIFLNNIESARKKIMDGVFPEYIIQRLTDLLDYYGQAPIIVRSSSLLEDAFGNAFAGKYESVFCPNQGTRKKRLENLIRAIKTVYASTMSKEALLYRKSRGVLDRDEQMPLLIQRVSGIPRGPYFLPQLSGVGFSFNPYAWNREIDPRSGMIRLVYGLGTRAVDRSDNDYTRVIALNAPSMRPESNSSEKKKYSQKKVDLLNLEQNIFGKCDFEEICPMETHMNLFGSRDIQAERYYRERGLPPKAEWYLSFENLIEETEFIQDISGTLNTIKKIYGSNIDIEFTCNFFTPGDYKICLVQCRPFQVDEHDIMDVRIPEIKEKNLLMKACGAVVGRSGICDIDYIIYVDPGNYGTLPDQDRYAVARIIGSLLKKTGTEHKTVLIGPGRWGTSTPSLGVPVSFSEIRRAYAIIEIDTMHEGLVPDLSLGTHFFNEMIETGMVYAGYFNNRPGNIFNNEILLNETNKLADFLPDKAKWAHIIHILEFRLSGRNLRMAADPVDQIGVLYFTQAPDQA
ncbi:MAG: hypothetical protein JXR86_07335 [Spirochaetales bacterium]|nr:hypothetical protein [Spirochaetales bacterium]